MNLLPSCLRLQLPLPLHFFFSFPLPLSKTRPPFSLSISAQQLRSPPPATKSYLVITRSHLSTPASHPSSQAKAEANTSSPQHSPVTFRRPFRPPQDTISDATTTRRITTTSSTQWYKQVRISSHSKNHASLFIVFFASACIQPPVGRVGPGFVPGPIHEQYGPGKMGRASSPYA